MYQRSTRALSVLVIVSVLFMLMAGIALPASAAQEALPSVTEAASSDATAFGIGSVEELIFAGENESLFESGDTLYLTENLTLIGEDRFKGFEGLKASFDGQGHTIYGWTAASRGLFYNCPMASIKNLTLYKVKLDASNLGGAQWPALVFGMQQAALSTLQPTFTMENVHVRESELIRYSGNDTGAAVLLSRYRVGAKVTVNITDCSVIDTAIIGSTARNNVAAIMGGVSMNVTGDSVFNISDIYVNGFSHQNAANHCGILFGEMRRTMNISNIAVYNSSMAAFGNEGGDPCDAAMIGRVFEGPIHLENILMAGNTLTSGEGGTFVTAMHSSASAVEVSYENIYCDDGALTPYEGGEKSVITKDFAAFESGEVGYLAADGCNWAMKDQMPAPATAAEQIRKITVSGASNKVFYANSGAELNLSELLPGMVFACEQGLSAEGTVLKVPEEDVSVTAYKAEAVAGDAAAAIHYFELRDAKYYDDGLEGALENVKDKLESGTVNANDVAALEGYKGRYKVLAPSECPSVREIALYPDMKGFLILEKEDLLAEGFNTLSADQVVYLGADLDLSGFDFEGFSRVKFSFDGQNHTISNWTAASRGLFDWFGGNFVKNLKLSNVALTWSTSDGAGLVVGRRYTAAPSNFTVSNVHVSASKVTNLGDLVDDGGAILLGTVSRPVNTETADLLSYGAGKKVTLKNCTVTDTAIEGKGRQRVAALMGHVWGGFSYEISDTEVVGFTDCAAAPAALLLGESERSKVTLTNVALFDSEGAATAVTALGEGAKVTAKNLLAADSVALSGGVTYTASFSDQKGDGVTTLSAAAFKNGEAAWCANQNSKVWKVGEGFGYPSLHQAEEPLRITFKEGQNKTYYYTDSEGIMLLDAQQEEALSQKISEQDFVYGSEWTEMDDLKIAFTGDTTVFLKSDLDGQIAAGVDAKIEVIGTVTLESKGKIEEARAAFDALTEDQQSYVTKLAVLEAAEARYQALLDQQIEVDKAAADAVEELIDGIGQLQLSAIPAIEEAQAAFGGLTSAQQGYVENYSKLVAYVDSLRNSTLGDVNMDDRVSIADAVLLLRYTSEFMSLNKLNYYVANLNGDDKIDTADVIILLRR